MDQALQLARQPALNFFDLCKLLATLYANGTSLTGDFLQKCGMSRRRLYYLVVVGRLVERTGLAKPEAERVGWTKLQIVSRHMGKGEVQEAELRGWLDVAHSTKARDLAKVLRREKVETTRGEVFHLNQEERAELETALLAFGAERARRGLCEKERAIMSIIRSAMEKRSAEAG